MMIGSEKLLLTLGIQAEKKDDVPITTRDVEILDISVKSSWSGDSISEVYSSIEERVGRSPSYVISDNDSKICKAIRLRSYNHIRDVSHTLALIIEHQYKKDEEFVKLHKDLAALVVRGNMKLSGYLLPPRQRTIARFMNLSPLINWSRKMLKIVDSLPEEERKVFEFIKDHESIITELTAIVNVYNNVSSLIKCNGLSTKTVEQCKQHISKLYQSPYYKASVIANNMMNYLLEDVSKMQYKDSAWHCSSDIIESIFGTYKGRKSDNKLNGVTTSILMLPVLTRRDNESGKIDINYKNNFEKVFLKEINIWKEDKLTENLFVKRRKKLKAA